MGITLDIPVNYNEDGYVLWHNTKWPEDDNIKLKLEKFRDNLKDSIRNDLTVLNELLYYIIPNCSNDYKIDKKEFTYDIPLKDCLNESNKVAYDLLFKSVKSIIDKLWRKNKKQEVVNLKNIQEHINDLVRTEVICSTLDACKYVSNHLKSEHIHLPTDYPLNEKYNKTIDKILFEPEMKMASGYFAYHGLVYFKSGLIVELQIYSSLTSTWRKLSHKLYEKARLNNAVLIDFGTSEARLISLGHLLHLAECEVMRIQEEIK